MIVDTIIMYNMGDNMVIITRNLRRFLKSGLQR